MMADDIRRILELYPRVFLACHTRHVRDTRSGRVLSAHQASILDHLDTDAPMMVGDLARHLGVTSATMSISIGRLVEQGYVTRVLDEADRRKVQLRLTDAGARVCAANSVLEPALVEEMLDQLSPADRKAALHGLELLGRAAMDAQDERSRRAAAKRGRRSA